MGMIVKLSHGPNPDIMSGGYWSQPVDHGVQEIEVEDFAEASRVCREYIERNNLGGGNWDGGQVMQDGMQVAKVSYNGRIWSPGEWKSGDAPLYSPGEPSPASHKLTESQMVRIVELATRAEGLLRYAANRSSEGHPFSPSCADCAATFRDAVDEAFRIAQNGAA
jgi:hypothetical protein